MKLIVKTFVAVIAAAAALVGCAEMGSADVERGVEDCADGKLSVRMKFDDVLAKSGVSDYLVASESEKTVFKVAVLVFDKVSGVLNASKQIEELPGECTMTLPVGEKLIYAVVNGPDLGAVTTLGQFMAMKDVLVEGGFGSKGLTLIGSAVCDVKSGETAEPEIVVSWLVSRVVLKNITCNVAQQYGGMTVDCVYLGNANTVQDFSGNVDGMVNPDGYADKEKSVQIGKNGKTGECSDYLYREIGAEISVGETVGEPYHMYCQPNDTEKYTCMYILATIGGVQYYYRVPLDKSLIAGSTCSVDLTIANLGSLVPPSEDYQNGAVQAVITIGGWTAGNSYVAEF